MFERVCLASLIHNDEYAKKVLPHIKEEYFSDIGEKEIFKMIHEYVGKYTARPTVEALAITLQDTKMTEMNFERTRAVLLEVAKKPETDDVAWLYDRTERWAKDRALEIAIHKSIGIIEGKDGDTERNMLPSILSSALAVSFDTNLGHNYFEDAAAQWEYINSEDTRIPFAQDTMNRITKGGVGKKTLNIVMAPINMGKSTILIDFAAHWVEMGKNVVYFTLEVAENVIRLRMDVRLLHKNFDAVFGIERDDFIGQIAELGAKTHGNLIIKEFPPGAAHVGHLRHFLDELVLIKGIKVDMVCVDYLTLLGSAKLPANARTNSNTYFTSVAEELRALAVEFDIPIWTAIQYGRDGQSKAEVDMADMALAIGIANTADFMVAFMQSKELAEMGQVVGKLLKSRYSNKAKINNFLMGLDNELQTLYDIGESDQRRMLNDTGQQQHKTPSGPKLNEGNTMANWKI